MKKRPLLMLALMGMAMPLPRAWSIDAACVEGTAKCQCPDGHWVPVSCSQDCSPALCGIGGGSGSGGGEGGGGLTPIQNMQFQAALGTEQALVTGFVQWLLSPDPNAGKMKQQKLQEQRQAEELERQRIAEERRQRELARIRFQNQNNQLLAKLKDNAPDQKLKLKDPDIEQTLTSLKNQARTIDCATSEIYDTADTLGEQGAQFSSGMSQQTLQAMKNLAQLPSDGAARTYDVIALSQDSMSAGVKSAVQLVMNTLVTRERETGKTHIDVTYTYSKDGKELKTGQSVAILNSLGDVECQDVTPATAKCMARFNPASANVHNCPKPPPGASTAQHPTPPVNEAASPDAVQLKYGALKP